MKSILLCDTTKEEREQYVRESLEYTDVGCECQGGGIDYQPYIDGKKEIAELAAEYKASFIAENPRDYPSSSCMAGLL